LKDLTAGLKVQTDRLRQLLASDLTAFDGSEGRVVEVVST